LDLKVDVRAGRIRSKDEEPRVASAPAALEPAKLAENAQASEASAPKVVTRHDPARALDDLDSVFEPSAEPAQKPALATATAPRKEAKAEGQLARQAGAALGPNDTSRLGGGAALADKRRSEKSAFPASTPAPAASSPVASANGIGSMETEALRKRGADAVGTGGKRKSAAVEDLLTASPQPAASSARGAASQAEPEAPSTVTRLSDARALARERGCGAAIASYEQVVAAAPGTAIAGQALLEMAQCKRTLGDEAAARALLERATHVAAVAERARALLAPAPAAPARPAESTLNPYR
jgi:hypothetical protein